MRAFLVLLSAAASALTLPSTVLAQDEVRVYRCIDDRGRVALGDAPCADGQRQEVRTMVRPVDGTPLERPTPPAPAMPAAPAPQIVMVNTPQPMYRCVRPDGSDYTSDSSEGNLRWVPLWTSGYGYGPPRRPVGSQVDVGIEVGRDGGRIDVDGSIGPRRPHRHIGYGPAGTWVRDTCRPMPQAEVCSLIRDRRETIRRRFFNAQPTEREQLRGEERAINARLGQDCAR